MPNMIRRLQKTLGATARANKYRVRFAWPRGIQGSTPLRDVDTLVKAAVAPQKEIGMIELWNQGRKLVIPGDTSFDNSWNCTFYLPENHNFRIDMLKWQQAADNFHKNKHSGNPEAIFANIIVEQLDSDGKPSAIYTLHNVFPQVVGEVSYGDDSSDTPVEFDVTFAYTDWVVGRSGDDDTCNIIEPSRNDTAPTC